MRLEFIAEIMIKATVVALGIQGAVAYLVLLERRTASWMQDRIGPNRCGPFGLLQPIADGVKLLFKEDIIPNHVHRAFYVMAPALTLLPALATLAVVPFGSDIVIQTDGGDRVVKLQVADVNVGVLYVFALASLGVYGLTLGGWASNSKYSLLGAIRAAAQLISHELALTLSVLTVILAAGTLRLNAIVLNQGPWPWQWHVFGFGAGVERAVSVVPLLVAAIIFVVAALAETNRLPFDMAEAESELVSGYHTEFSSMKFGLFMLSEYANMLTACSLMATMFFGGWLFPGWDSSFMLAHPILLGLCSVGTFTLKVVACMFLMMWIRWTLPRFRFDQLMDLGWKRLLPAAMACVTLAAAARVLSDLPWSVSPPEPPAAAQGE